MEGGLTAPTSSHRNWTSKGGHVTVQALLDLAFDTCPDQISTAAVTERMGLSHGALFRHFPSRDALWVEAVTWAIDELERH
jgi:hypothetical protein